MQGRVFEIFIAKTACEKPTRTERAVLEAGKGIVGDRYHSGNGTFSEMLAGKPLMEVTLIEKEKIDAFNLKYGTQLGYAELRRNIVTLDIDLNALADKTFTIGNAILRGIKLCEPCPHLADVLLPEILPGMKNRGGLRAQILQGGTIHHNDFIKETIEKHEFS